MSHGSVPLRARLGREDGQVMPLLPVVFLAILALTVMLVFVARATSLSSQGQTAADAAALAGENNVKAQLDYLDGGALPREIDVAAVRAAAEEYAERNDAHVVELHLEGLDVLVTVETNARAGNPDHTATSGAFARARATLGASVGGTTAGGVVNFPAAPPGPDGTVFAAMLAEANRMAALHQPYDHTGASHAGTLSPPNGPWDCSSAVSRILQAAGFKIPNQVSSSYLNFGEPGAGAVTLEVKPGLMYSGHVYIVFNDGKGHVQAFGTTDESASGGFAAIHGYTYQGPPFVARHIPLPSLDKHFDPSSVNLGSAFVPGTPIISFDVHLVPLSGGSTSTSGGLTDLNASQLAIVKTIVEVGRKLGASQTRILAAIEAGIVESTLRNLPLGAASDGSDSIGVFQMRPSQGWGSPSQLNDVSYAAAKFFSVAAGADHGQSSGALAADVENPRSDLRYKYADQEAAARHWLAQVGGGK